MSSRGSCATAVRLGAPYPVGDPWGYPGVLGDSQWWNPVQAILPRQLCPPPSGPPGPSLVLEHLGPAQPQLPLSRPEAHLATPRPDTSPGLDPSSLGLPPRVTRPGVSVRGLQVMSPRKCRAGVGLTPNPDPLHPAHRPLDRASVGRGGKGGWHQADGRRPPTKGKGKERLFHKPFPLIASACFRKCTTFLEKKNSGT